MTHKQSAIPPRIKGAEWLERHETQAVFAALATAGHAARAVGGAVRNTLLGTPVADIDIATSAPPQEMMRAAALAHLKVVPTGLAHGTVTIVSGHIPYEVTTLRQDVETFGRHAKVAYTTDWEADARRRDFTMNALYCDARGEVLDCVGGYGDLLARRVRFIGDPLARIREDFLRILRFFRFSATYGEGRLDAAGLEASIGERAGLDGLSGERIRAELVKLLIAPHAAPAIAAMAHAGLLGRILGAIGHLPAFSRLADTDQRHGDTPEPMLRLAALAVRIEEDAERLAMRLRLSNAETDLLKLAARHRELATIDDERSARAALYRFGTARYGFALRLAEALDPVAASKADRRQLLQLPARWQPPRLPVTGADLIALGFKPGIALGRVLGRLEADWIAEDFAPTRDDLLARARVPREPPG